MSRKSLEVSPGSVEYVENYYARREIKGQHTGYRRKLGDIPNINPDLRRRMIEHIERSIETKTTRISFTRRGKRVESYYSHESHRFVTKEGKYKARPAVPQRRIRFYEKRARDYRLSPTQRYMARQIAERLRRPD